MSEDTKIIYTANDIKNLLGIGRDKAYSLMKSGEFETRKIGTKIIVSKEIFHKWLNHLEDKK